MATGTYLFTENLYDTAGKCAIYLGESPSALLNPLNVRGGATGLTRAKAIFADYANTKVRSLMAQVDSLNAKTATLTVVAQGATCAIPVDLFRANIIEIAYAGPNEYAEKLPIRFIGKVDQRSLSPQLVNSQIYADVPSWVAFDQTEENFIFSPPLTQQTTFTITYNYLPTLWVGADFDDENSTTVSPIPDDYDEVLPMALAIDLARKSRRFDLAQQLANEFYGTPENNHFGLWEETKRELMNIPALMTRYRYSYSNVPQTALADNPFAGQYFGGRPGLKQ